MRFSFYAHEKSTNTRKDLISRSH